MIRGEASGSDPGLVLMPIMERFAGGITHRRGLTREPAFLRSDIYCSLFMTK